MSDVEMEIVPTTEDGRIATMRKKKHHATHDPEIDELLNRVKELCAEPVPVVDDRTGRVALKHRDG